MSQMRKKKVNRIKFLLTLMLALALAGCAPQETEESQKTEIDVQQGIETYMEEFVGMYMSEICGGDQKVFMQSKEVYADDFGGPIELTVYKNDQGEDIRYQVQLYGETGSSVTDYYLCEDFIYVNQEKNYYSSRILALNYDDVLYRETTDWIILDDTVYEFLDNGEMEADEEYSFYPIKEVMGWAEETDEPLAEVDEAPSVRRDSIDQLEIQGRTQEETELIHKILSEDKEEFEEFLTTDWDFPHELEAIEILTYDFTSDGKDEIIVSKFYFNLSAYLTYNYVYDQGGRKMMEFVGGHPLEMQMIDDWDGEGTFLLYTMNHYAAHCDADIYTEIRLENDALTERVVLMELDRRYGGDEGKEEYYIFKDLTKEEEEKLWYGASGVNELTKTKACFKEGEEPEAYERLFRERETECFPILSVILYSEEDGFVEYLED